MAKLFDRFSNKKTNFADGTSIARVSTEGRSEIGVAGESLIGFEGSEARTDKLNVTDYVKMRQNDGTVASLYNILTLPIVANSYSFEADEDDATEEQKNFIENALTAPPHQGGMETPLPLVLADMMRAVLEGFRLFEKVYALQDGRVIYRKLASRAGETIYLQRSDGGGYGGAVQLATFKGEYYNVTIPAWKTFLFTYGKDKNYLYGESAFKAAYYHYDKKHRLYYLSELQAQRFAIPPGIATGPSGGNNKVKDDFLSALKKFGQSRAFAYVPEGFDLKEYGKTGAFDLMSLIEHHDNAMARSILAQFLMLGTGVRASTGSWALSRNHSDIFMMALQGLMQNIEDHINFYLIPDLIDLNFSTPHYPRFKFEDMTADAQTTMRDAFNAMISAGVISQAMVKGIEEGVAQSLGIDLDALEEQVEEEQTEEDAEGEQPEQPAATKGGKKAPLPKPPAGSAKPEQPSKAEVAASEGGGDPKGSRTSDGSDLSRQQRSESILRSLRHGLIP